MAIAFVNATRGGGSASDNNWTCTAASHTTGNLIVAHVNHEGAATTINSINDTAGNTYTPLTYRSHSNGDLHGQIWYAKNIAGNASNVLTIDMAASRPWRAVQILQYSGCDTTSPFDQENWGEIASGTSLTTGNVTTTQADEVLVKFSGDYNGNTYSVSSPWTERLDLNNSPAGAYGASADQIVSATGTYSGAMTQSASAANILLLATFKAASTGHTATGAITLGGISLAGTAAEAIPGTASIVLPAATLNGQGVMVPNGVGALTLAAASLSGVGTETFTSTGALVLSGVTLSAQGVEVISGAAALLFSGVSLSASGVMVPDGAGGLLLATPILAASGEHANVAASGTGGIVVSAASLAGLGVMVPNGVGAILLVPITIGAAGIGGISNLFNPMIASMGAMMRR